MGLLLVTGVQQIPAGSPNLDYDICYIDSCYVENSGNVYNSYDWDYFITDSYGEASPYTDYDHIVCCVFSGGNVYWCDNVTFSSYG